MKKMKNMPTVNCVCLLWDLSVMFYMYMYVYVLPCKHKCSFISVNVIYIRMVVLRLSDVAKARQVVTKHFAFGHIS